LTREKDTKTMQYQSTYKEAQTEIVVRRKQSSSSYKIIIIIAAYQSLKLRAAIISNHILKAHREFSVSQINNKSVIIILILIAIIHVNV